MTAATATQEPASRGKVIFAFLVVTAIWGSTWLVIKDQVGAVPPTWSITYRFALAGVGMLVLALLRRDSLRLSRQGMGLALLVGLSQFVCNFQFVYQAEIHLTSGLVAVCYALLMLPNAVLARVFLGQKVTPGFVAGSLVAIVGIALLMVHEYRSAPPEGRVALGVLMTCAGILSASTANILQGTKLGRSQPMVPMLAWAMLLGAAIDAGWSLATVGAPVMETRWEYLAGIAYLAIAGSVVTFPLYFMLIRELGPGRAAYNGVAVPVVAMALSTLFEGYRWTGLAIGGAVLALAGLVIALVARKRG
ncbi:DMT family transporter [Novosphingobium guangzhouense]|uniref:Multidrug transporter n=1 Tax=Novosphingobium guangzhouense TaxID=1850347 RepID=A0A2K2FZ60_9SPHN|nr:EamA family transporter [Novosphingobium guangzhouense]PNU04081.1 multidrug transporter [Novosphingobium guangzhouense]